MHQLRESTSKSLEKRIFPVVFHVLHVNGYENISEAQIFNVLDQLNADFQKMNADTMDVVAPFDSIIGLVNFEFRLARLNPDGNPTDGIDRILTPLTENADEHSKLNTWNPEKYINIWVVKSFRNPVVAITPNPLVSGPDACQDGIMILNDYLGTIGTAGPNVKHFLTHEMGHFFGLSHLVDNPYNTNGNDCAYSDGIVDTPHQTVSYSCDYNSNSCNDSLFSDSFNYWGYDVQDMVQNFMMVGYCTRMFSKDQAVMMRAVQENPNYGRWQLSDSMNLILTGVGSGPPIVSSALPGAAFASNWRMACVGDSIQMINSNGYPAGVTYQWSFPGGASWNPTAYQPKVAYQTPGYYDVTLTATNVNGTRSETLSGLIYVSGNWPEYLGPTLLDLDTAGAYWQQFNKYGNSMGFTWIPNLGVDGSGCFRLAKRYDPDSSMACYDHSSNQLKGQVYELVTPAFDLQTTSGITVSFDYAYGSAAFPDSAEEKLMVYASTNCGKSWVQQLILSDTSLVCSTASVGIEYTPSASDWKHALFTWNPSTGYSRFKLAFIASNESNFLYVDNFRIDGTLSLNETAADLPLIYPNPADLEQGIHLSHLAAGNYQVEMFDMQGKRVYSETKQQDASDPLVIYPGVMQGMYLLRIHSDKLQFVYQVAIQ